MSLIKNNLNKGSLAASPPTIKQNKRYVGNEKQAGVMFLKTPDEKRGFQARALRTQGLAVVVLSFLLLTLFPISNVSAQPASTERVKVYLDPSIYPEDPELYDGYEFLGYKIDKFDVTIDGKPSPIGDRVLHYPTTIFYFGQVIAAPFDATVKALAPNANIIYKGEEIIVSTKGDILVTEVNTPSLSSELELYSYIVPEPRENEITWGTDYALPSIAAPEISRKQTVDKDGKFYMDIHYLADVFGARCSIDYVNKTIKIETNNKAPLALDDPNIANIYIKDISELRAALNNYCRNTTEVVGLLRVIPEDTLYSEEVKEFNIFNNRFKYIVDGKKVTETLSELNFSVNYEPNSEYLMLLPEYMIIDEKYIIVEANKKAREIVKRLIHDGMSDEQKITVLNNYICENVIYDYDTYYRMDELTEFSPSYIAYGALIKGKAVCAGYAEAFNRLLYFAGVESYVISGKATSGGTTERHAWNLVKIGDKYLHVDTTWNDTGSSRTKYLLKDDNYMKQTHQWEISQ